MKQLLHTPEGVRDIYNQECAKKLAVQDKLHEMFHLYGYHDIQTPTFEYFDVFRKEIGTISSRELYKFFDREGNTLVLRPDITPSIARAAATLYEQETMPIRLCYIGNTFINHSSYLGRLKGIHPDGSRTSRCRFCGSGCGNDCHDDRRIERRPVWKSFRSVSVM